MSLENPDPEGVIRICRGNKEAIHWIQVGRRYIHEIDDLIDEDIAQGNKIAAAERVCVIGVLAIELYTHPFFLRWSALLSGAMIMNTNNFADSVKWEKTDSKWKNEFSDWARHGWIDVVLMVAYICGGFENMRAESEQLRTFSYEEHHDEKGQAC